MRLAVRYSKTKRKPRKYKLEYRSICTHRKWTRASERANKVNVHMGTAKRKKKERSHSRKLNGIQITRNSSCVREFSTKTTHSCTHTHAQAQAHKHTHTHTCDEQTHGIFLFKFISVLVPSVPCVYIIPYWVHVMIRLLFFSVSVSRCLFLPLLLLFVRLYKRSSIMSCSLSFVYEGDEPTS